MRKIRMVVLLVMTTGVLALLFAAAAGARPALHRASGGGSFDASGNEFSFAFNARQLDDYGNAKGQFEFHNRTNGSMMHLKIVFMAVDDDVAWLGGIVTKAVNTNAPVGAERVVRLKDSGEGSMGAGDECSKLSNQDAEDALEKPNLTLFPLNNGNIQVR